MSLTFRLDAAPPIVVPHTPEYLSQFLLSLYSLVLTAGEEVECVRAGLFHCSLSLTLPPTQPAPALPAVDSESSSGTAPTLLQRHLELCVMRRGSQAVWESPLVTEQRSEAFLCARRHAEEDAALGTVWRLPPIDVMLLCAGAVEALFSEEAATALPLRAFRRRAFDLGEQRERVRAGGEPWTRLEQLKLLSSLRTQARSVDGEAMTLQHKAVMDAFAAGELALGGEEEEGAGSAGSGGAGSGGGAGAAAAQAEGQ